MKRVIKSSDDWLIDNLMHGKKFRVCAEEERCFTTDDPKSAITKWFKFGAKHPTASAITVASVDAANELRKCVRGNKEWFITLYNKYECPYDLDYLIDACEYDDTSKYRFVDSVFPFCYG